MQQTRSTQRKLVGLLVKLAHKGLDEFAAKYATNLSEGGMFIRTREPRPVGTELSFKVEIANGLRVLEGTALVKWTRPDNDPGGPPGMGLEFVTLEPSSRELVDRMLGRPPRAEVAAGFDPFDRAAPLPKPPAPAAKPAPPAAASVAPAIKATVPRVLAPTVKPLAAPAPDVELPVDHLLGPLHGGWGVGMAVLTSERGHIGTSVIGLERRLESMSRLAEGHDLTPTERQRLATLLSKGQAYKAMAQRQGPIASTAASLMKLGITEMMFDTSMLRADLSGAEAMLDGAEAFGMLQAPGGRIAGGTSQVQRNIIGERLLGLPREPKG